MLGFFDCDEEDTFWGRQAWTVWRYRLADEVEPTVLASTAPDPESVPDPTAPDPEISARFTT